MKKVVTLLLIFALISFTTKNKPKNTLTLNNLKGNVKILKEFSFVAEFKFGELSKGKRKRGDWNHEKLDYVQKYDNKGNLVETNFYKTSGRLDNKITYKYDDKGNKIEMKKCDSFGGVKNEITYEYDEKGNKIEINSRDFDNKLDNKITYKYDDIGIEIEMKAFYLLNDKYVAEYSSKSVNKGGLIERDWFNSDGKLTHMDTSKYDERGNQIEITKYHSDGSFNDKYTFKYDDKGNKIEENSCDSDGVIKSVYTSKYDNNGNEIEVNYEIPEYFLSTFIIPDTACKYDYDEKGNWIKCIVFEYDTPEYIVERVIEYY